jgi:hypothetical protein
MNPLPGMIARGTFGEILVQLYLLEFDVQAAPPIKDSGNDLIAIRGDTFRAFQVKTSVNCPFKFELGSLPQRYHVLALVKLDKLVLHEDGMFDVSLDTSRVYLVERKDVTKGIFSREELEPWSMTRERVEQLFPRPPLLQRQISVRPLPGSPFDAPPKRNRKVRLAGDE